MSRVGGKAQNRAMFKVAGSLRLDLAAYRELEAFAQLGTELDAATQAQLDRGARMVELLKQLQYRPYHVSEQIIAIFAGVQGYLDDLSVSQVREFEEKLLAYFRDEFPEVVEELTEKKELPPVEDKLHEIIKNFKPRFAAAEEKAEAGGSS